jgi:hypothetical protein
VKLDNSLIEAALVGYQEELKQIDEKMKALRQRIHQAGGNGAKGETAGTEKKSRLSPAARRRIAAAQRKRWAAYKAALAGKS